MTFKSWREFAYAILENEDSFRCIVCGKDGALTIVEGYGNAMDFFVQLLRDWGQMREKLDNYKISKEEYEGWKRTWGNGT